MKRILSLILCLSVLLGSQIPAFAYKAEDVTELLDFMHMLGIMEDYDAETFSIDQQVTRAMFADNVVDLIREGDVKTNKVYYHDISKDYWAFQSVGRLTELGIINGDGENCFNPDKVITKAEVAKILLSVLGYNEFALTAEDYPQGYIRKATDIKLFEKCSGKNEITMLDMLYIFRNALEANVITAKLTVGKQEYQKSDVTLLEHYYDMYFGKGVVTGCGGVDISSGARIDEDKVYIDNVQYNTELTDLIGYLGLTVEFIYSEDDYGDYELVWLKSTGKSETLKLEANIEKKFDSDEYVLSYQKENSTSYKHLKISRSINVVYNGAYVKTGIEEIFSKDKYSVTFVGNGGDYNLAIVEAYENYVVGDIDTANYTVYDKLSGTTKISLDEKDWEVVEIIKNGSTAAFSDIKNGDVLSIFKSYDENSVKAVISSNIVEGNIEGISNDETIEIKVDGKIYEFYDNNIVNNARAGDLAKLYLDFNGFVVDITFSIGKETVAYVIRAYVDSETDNVNIKMLTREGVKNYECSSKLSINGQRANDSLIANELTGIDGQTVQRMIVARFDSEQKIRKITLPGSAAESDFNLYMSGVGGRYRNSIGKIGKKVLIDDETQIFSVPSAYSTNSEDFAYKTKKNMVEDKDYTVDVYRYRNDNLEYEDILVMKDADWHQSYDWEATVLVDKIYDTLNDDDEVVECLSGYKGSSTIKINTDGKYSLQNQGIKSGDLIKVRCDEKGNIDGASVIYSYGGSSRPITSDINASFRIATVYANDKIGNALRTGYTSGAQFDEVFNINGAPILVYDPEEGAERIRIGTMGDIRTYKTSGNNCSTVVVQTNYMNPIMFVVYAN